MRATLMPLAVEPAHPPIIMSVRSSILEKVGHVSKSAETKPVVESDGT